MSNLPVIKRLDVDTPLGVVHLVSFPKGGVRGDSPCGKVGKTASEALDVPTHRQVIFDLLTEVTGHAVTAADLVQTEEHPRPEFPHLDFDVNWTHSGDLCVVAYTEAGSAKSVDGGRGVAKSGLCVGVDLEVHKAKHLRVAERFYSPEERNRLRELGLAAPAAVAEFFRLWCRKEALYKCVGGNFFEGAVGRCVLQNPLPLKPLETEGGGAAAGISDCNAAVSAAAGAAARIADGALVHFVDLDGSLLGVARPDCSASLCVAVSTRFTAADRK